MCTGLMLRTEDGSVVHGRTVEFGIDIPSDILFFPRGQEFTGTAPGGATGKTYRARFAFVGGDMGGNQQAADGLNEAGLAVARDPQHLRLYWRTYADQTIRMVDLAALKETPTLKKISGQGQQPILDMTSALAGA